MASFRYGIVNKSTRQRPLAPPKANIKASIKMSNIAALRAKLQASAQKGDSTAKSKGSGGDNASFPFWDIPF